MKDFYDTLGIARDADKDTIRKAYRKKAMKTHPDQGGDEEEFKTLALAKRVLMDDDERAFYDRTGNVNNGKTIESEAEELLVNTVQGILAEFEDDVFWKDPVKMMVEGCQRQQTETKNKIKKHKTNMKRLKKVLKKFKRKKDGRRFIEDAIQRMIHQESQSMCGLEKANQVYSCAEKMMAEYEFAVEDKGTNPIVDAKDIIFGNWSKHPFMTSMTDKDLNGFAQAFKRGKGE